MPDIISLPNALNLEKFRRTPPVRMVLAEEELGSASQERAQKKRPFGKR